MKLVKDAKVYASDGQEIGSLSRFVLDPKTKQVTHIVISRGLLGKQEYLAPVPMITQADETGIHLKDLPFDRVGDLDTFQEERYVPANDMGRLGEGYVSDQLARGDFYYPPAPGGGEGWVRTGEMYVNNVVEDPPHPVRPTAPVGGESHRVRKETQQNIPEGMVALKEGAKVVGRQGQAFGSVEKVLMDDQSQQATHLVITRGLLTKTRKLIPVEWVQDISESAVTLSVEESQIEGLPDYGGQEAG